MGWAIFYMVVILKIPLALMLWLIWWSVHEPPEAEGQQEEEDGDDGGSRHLRPRRPRPPRRGSGCAPQPSAPRRVRTNARRPMRKHA